MLDTQKIVEDLRAELVWIRSHEWQRQDWQMTCDKCGKLFTVRSSLHGPTCWPCQKKKVASVRREKVASVHHERPEIFPGRKDEMLRLYNEVGWSYQAISEKFGISRERVRQIIGAVVHKDGNNSTPSVVAERELIQSERRAVAAAHPEWTTSRLAKELGIRENSASKYWGGMRHATENEFTQRGSAIEEYVSAQLTDRGIKNTLTNSRPYDIILEDGRTIEIKSRHKPCKTSDAENFYFFCLYHRSKKKTVPPADFYILVIANGNNSAFVLPRAAVPPSMAVSFCWPQGKQSRGRYLEYLDRYDLLLTGATLTLDNAGESDMITA